MAIQYSNSWRNFFVMARTGIDVVHVPYKGIAPATLDLLSGQIQAMTASIPATLPLAAEKRVRVLAVTGPRRIPQLPDVPSWQEQGVPNAEVINYWGIVAPAGTPPAVVARLNADVQKVLAQPTESGKAMTMGEFDRIRPAWMPQPASLPTTFGCSWPELPGLRLSE